MRSLACAGVTGNCSFRNHPRWYGAYSKNAANISAIAEPFPRMRGLHPDSTAPPLYPHCRPTIVGSLKEYCKQKDQRVARNTNGKYIRIPADMTYRKWYNKDISKETEKGYRCIIGINTSTGQKITNMPNHLADRSIEKEVSLTKALDPLKHPLKAKPIKKRGNGQSQEYINTTARVIANPDTGNIIAVWKTSCKLRAKYKKGDAQWSPSTENN